MSDKIYVVKESDEWDSWPISNHRTKKGAWKAIIETQYEDWMLARYIPDGHQRYLYIDEQALLD
jgi:hypothetical protein